MSTLHDPRSSWHAPGDEVCARIIFAQARPLTATPGERYLVHYAPRRMTWPDDLRYYGKCPRGPGENFPAILALLRDIHTSEPCGIGQLFLRGDRPHVALDRRTLGRVDGACIKLTADEDVTNRLCLANSLESALSLMSHRYAPMWVTCGASGLASFPALNGIDSLTVCIDNEHAMRAAHRIADRWQAAGCEVQIVSLIGANDETLRMAA